MRRHLLILGVGAMLVFGFASASWFSGPVSRSGESVPERDVVSTGASMHAPRDVVTPEELALMLDGAMDFALIDVRAFSEGMRIPGTTLAVSAENILATSALPANLALPIVVYGAGTGEGELAAEALLASGRENVYALAGGIDAWTTAGYALADIPL